MAKTFKPAGGTRENFDALFDTLDKADKNATTALQYCAALMAEMHGRYTPLTSYAALEARVTALEARVTALEGGSSDA